MDTQEHSERSRTAPATGTHLRDVLFGKAFVGFLVQESSKNGVMMYVMCDDVFSCGPSSFLQHQYGSAVSNLDSSSWTSQLLAVQIIQNRLGKISFDCQNIVNFPSSTSEAHLAEDSFLFF